MKAITTDATQVLINLRDQLIKEASELKDIAEQDLTLAKQLCHQRRIKANQLNKQADRLQDIIDKEKEAQIKEQNRLNEIWRIKSQTEINLENMEKNQCGFLD